MIVSGYDAAIKTFKAVSTDPAKLKIFCDMSKAMDEAGEKPSPAADAKINGYMKQLGSDFEIRPGAWRRASTRTPPTARPTTARSMSSPASAPEPLPRSLTRRRQDVPEPE